MDGLLIIDKPAGWTSHDVVARARRLLREKRAGHTGTLDPFATGVLVLLLGRATRLAQFFTGAEKEYEAAVRLGRATDTGDLTGTPLAAAAGAADCASLTRSAVERALSALRGEIEQVPPMYSAKKVGGRRLYELARQGGVVERAAVRVRVETFEIARDGAGAIGRDGADGVARDGAGAVGGDDAAGGSGRDGAGAWLRPNEDGTCDLTVRVVCSAGTYVRALAESLGASLGVGAHLAALRRTRAGTFRVAESVTLERLAGLAEAGRAGDLIIPMNAALPAMPETHLTADEARRVAHGMTVAAPAGVPERWVDGARVRLVGPGGELLAVGVYDAARELIQPRVGLVGAEGAAK